RRLRLVLRGDREFVLLRARDLPLPGDVFGCRTHVIAVEGVPKTILDHRIDHLVVTHFHAVAQMRTVRRHAHGLLPARNDDFGIAVEDRLIAQRHGAQSGTAQLIDAPGGGLDGYTGADRGLPRGILPLAGSENLTHDDFGHIWSFDAGAFEAFGDRHLSEFVRRQARQSSIERTNWRAGGAHDDDVVLHHITPF